MNAHSNRLDVMLANIAGCGCKDPGTAQALVAWIRNSVGANYQDFELCRLWNLDAWIGYSVGSRYKELEQCRLLMHGLDTALAQVIRSVNSAGSGCMDLE
jgi:hypothetical protein